MSLLLAAALALGLSVPVLAAGGEMLIREADGRATNVNTMQEPRGDGWSYDPDTNTLTLSGIQNKRVILNGSSTVVLAPGSKNHLMGLRAVKSDESGTATVTFQGSGELEIYDPAASDAKDSGFLCPHCLRSVRLHGCAGHIPLRGRYPLGSGQGNCQRHQRHHLLSRGHLYPGPDRHLPVSGGEMRGGPP